MFFIIKKVSDADQKIVGEIDLDNLFDAREEFAKRFSAPEPCEGVWVDNIYHTLKRKKLSPNVFKIDFTTSSYYVNGEPDLALKNLEEVLKLYLPERCFGRYQRGINNFEHPEVKKELSYEFGDFDGQNWHRTPPNQGEFIGIFFGNRICDGLWYDDCMPKLVKKFKRKIGRRKEENFLIFRREKEIEKLNCLYK